MREQRLCRGDDAVEVASGCRAGETVGDSCWKLENDDMVSPFPPQPPRSVCRSTLRRPRPDVQSRAGRSSQAPPGGEESLDLPGDV